MLNGNMRESPIMNLRKLFKKYGKYGSRVEWLMKTLNTATAVKELEENG